MAEAKNFQIANTVFYLVSFFILSYVLYQSKGKLSYEYMFQPSMVLFLFSCFLVMIPLLINLCWSLHMNIKDEEEQNKYAKGVMSLFAVVYGFIIPFFIVYISAYVGVQRKDNNSYFTLMFIPTFLLFMTGLFSIMVFVDNGTEIITKLIQ